MAHHRKGMMSFEELDLETQVPEKGVVKWISDDTGDRFNVGPADLKVAPRGG